MVLKVEFDVELTEGNITFAFLPDVTPITDSPNLYFP